MKRLFLFVALFGLIASMVYAKSEVYVEDPETDWASLEEPWAIPGALDTFLLAGSLGEEDIDAFTTTFAEPIEDLLVFLHVPVCGDHFTQSYPSLVMMGQGLETDETLKLPFELPEEMGAVLITAESESSQAVSTRRARSNWGEIITYDSDPLSVDIPEAGDYTFVLWEPNGEIAAYLFEVRGSEHLLDENRPMREREAAFRLFNSGDWFGQECD